MNNLHIIVAFACGVIAIAAFEYPALMSAHSGLLDKNATIERLEEMVRECSKK